MCLVIAIIKQDRGSLRSRQSSMCDLVLNLDEQNKKIVHCLYNETADFESLSPKMK